MVESILALATVALKYMAQKDATKYLDEKISLEKEWYEEFNKPEDVRSNLTLDLIRRRVLILANNIVNADKSGQS